MKFLQKIKLKRFVRSSPELKVLYDELKQAKKMLSYYSADVRKYEEKVSQLEKVINLLENTNDN